MTEISPAEQQTPVATPADSVTKGSNPSGQVRPGVSNPASIIPATIPSPASEDEPQINLKDTSRVVDNIKELVQHLDRDLEFQIDDITGKTVVTVLNRETQEVIRQIPNEQLLSMAQRLKAGGGLIEELSG